MALAALARMLGILGVMESLTKRSVQGNNTCKKKKRNNEHFRQINIPEPGVILIFVSGNAVRQ